MTDFKVGSRVVYRNKFDVHPELDGILGIVTGVSPGSGKPYVTWDNGYRSSIGAPHSLECVELVYSADSKAAQAIAAQVTPRAELLREAEKLITGDRNATYGSPTQNFQDTAAIWTVQLGHKLKEGEKIDPGEVAALMIGLKLARIKASPKRDNWADISGYAGCGYEADKETGKIDD